MEGVQPPPASRGSQGREEESPASPWSRPASHQCLLLAKPNEEPTGKGTGEMEPAESAPCQRANRRVGTGLRADKD